MQNVSSEFSTSWWTERVALYGSTTVSETYNRWQFNIGLANRAQEETHLGRRHNGERAHHTVGIFFTDLRDQEGAHTGASATTERVGDLESLKAVASLCLLSDDIEYGVDEFSALSVVYRPVNCTDIYSDAEDGEETYVLWPSCYLRPLDRRQSCLDGTSCRAVRNEQSPSCRARGRRALHEGRTC